MVTSNKELVATHGYELLQLAKQHNVSYLFEASVGAASPIIRPINQCLAANELTEIAGILNGTTNYILTRMIRAGLSFEAALKEAQEKGYAERDPSADIEGRGCLPQDLHSLRPGLWPPHLSGSGAHGGNHPHHPGRRGLRPQR